MDELGILHASLPDIRSGKLDVPRTRKLLSEGRLKKAQKVGEEAFETVIEAVAGNRDATVREAADLMFNLVVLLEDLGIAPGEVFEEMAKRRLLLGVAEKEPKPVRPKAAAAATPATTAKAGKKAAAQSSKVKAKADARGRGKTASAARKATRKTS